MRNKLEYERLEMERFIRRHGITFQFNPFFPVNTLLLMRGAIAAQTLGVLERYVDAMFRHMWAAPKKMDDADVVRGALEESGFDSAQLLRVGAGRRRSRISCWRTRIDPSNAERSARRRSMSATTSISARTGCATSKKRSLRRRAERYAILRAARGVSQMVIAFQAALFSGRRSLVAFQRESPLLGLFRARGGRPRVKSSYPSVWLAGPQRLVQRCRSVPRIRPPAHGRKSPTTGATVGAIDELSCDAHTAAGLANASLEHVSDIQLRSNLSDVCVPTLEGERRRTSDHLQIRRLRQQVQDLLGNAI